MTKPKPSFSLRWITTSLVCRAVPSGCEMTAGMETAGGPEAEAASLRGELCCVDTDPGLRPFTGHGSPTGGEARGRRDESNQQCCYCNNNHFTSPVLKLGLGCSHHRLQFCRY